MQKNFYLNKAVDKAGATQHLSTDVSVGLKLFPSRVRGKSRGLHKLQTHATPWCVTVFQAFPHPGAGLIYDYYVEIKDKVEDRNKPFCVYEAAAVKISPPC